MTEELSAKGWTYRDMPRVTPEVFAEYLEIVGAENVKFLTFATYKSESGEAVRGQHMISPQGVKNLIEWQNKR